jgi:hypothetical protein
MVYWKGQVHRPGDLTVSSLQDYHMPSWDNNCASVFIDNICTTNTVANDLQKHMDSHFLT